MISMVRFLVGLPFVLTGYVLTSLAEAFIALGATIAGVETERE